jgi:lipopolysaccharide/colanic/teichoic acid biosynthesis glycosyltransferase
MLDVSRKGPSLPSHSQLDAQSVVTNCNSLGGFVRANPPRVLPSDFLRGRGQFAVKRLFDFSAAALACIVLSPILLAIAAIIKLTSTGPIFFMQERRGFNYESFTMLKFRSMLHEHPDPYDRYETTKSDPRITKVGRWLRATSLDELPQLFNVIEGSMSLVGPRPLVEWESREALQRFSDRFTVKPGITGWCQITVRNSVDLDGRCEKDIEYIRRFSLLLDMVILARTPFSLLRTSTIYPKA